MNEVYEDAVIETYAAATKVIDTGHGLATLAVWAEGVIYELPEADYIVFANNDGHFTVPFSVVLDLVGILPTAGFFPPRYRVNGWPEPEVLHALRFHAVALPAEG